jgi:hypothetical protein
MIRAKGGSDRAPGVSRSGLNPDIRKEFRPQKLSIADAVECDTSRHTQFAPAGTRGKIAGYPQHRFIEDGLDGCRDVHVALSERLPRIAGQASEELREGVIRHSQPGRVVEVGHVEPK